MKDIVLREISPSYQVETPPESPTLATILKKTGKETKLSPYLNKMSLKRLMGDDEEEMDRKMFKTKEKESTKSENEMSVRLGKGKTKVKAKSHKENKKNEIIKKRIEDVLKK